LINSGGKTQHQSRGKKLRQRRQCCACSRRGAGGGQGVLQGGGKLRKFAGKGGAPPQGEQQATDKDDVPKTRAAQGPETPSPGGKSLQHFVPNVGGTQSAGVTLQRGEKSGDKPPVCRLRRPRGGKRPRTNQRTKGKKNKGRGVKRRRVGL